MQKFLKENNIIGFEKGILRIIFKSTEEIFVQETLQLDEKKED